jgi:nucleotide-binding universal stress UspA family protein
VSVTVLAVANGPPAVYGAFGGFSHGGAAAASAHAEAEKSAQKHALQSAENAREFFKKRNIAVTALLARQGDPGAHIVAEAAQHDLVVMGTHGKKGIERLLEGSVTEDVLRHLPLGKPLLSVKPRHDDKEDVHFRHILVPTDGSDGSRQACNMAIRLAERFGPDARVTLLHVMPHLADEEKPYFKDLQKALQENAESIVNTYVKDEKRRVQLETIVRQGRPADEILGVLENAGDTFDLVCMSTHGRSGLSRFIHGSVCERILRHTTLPVLCVRNAVTEKKSGGESETDPLRGDAQANDERDGFLCNC